MTKATFKSSPKARRPDTPRPKAKQVPALSRWSHDKLSHMADRFAKLTEDADKLFGDLEVADALRYSDPRNYQKAVEARKSGAKVSRALLQKLAELETAGTVSQASTSVGSTRESPPVREADDLADVDFADCCDC